MAKRLFHSCRSPSAAATITATTTLLPSSTHHVVPAPAGAACCPRSVPRRRPQPSTPPCGTEGTAANYGTEDHPPARGTPAYRWLKSSRWHVIEANTHATGDDDDAPRLKIDARRRVRRSCRCRRAAASASSSSHDSGWFSTDDEEQAYVCTGGADESSSTHVTSTTTDSSSTGASAHCVRAGAREEEPVALAGGFAVVKRSEDPRADFRRSMAEMVLWRGVYDVDGLQRLLRCFLALNDQRHHRDIIAAFGDVWEAVFLDDSPCDAHGDGAGVGSHASSSGTATATACDPVID